MNIKENLERICIAVLNDKYDSSTFMSYLGTALIEDDELQKIVDEIKDNLEKDIYTVLDEEQLFRRKKYAKFLLDIIK